MNLLLEYDVRGNRVQVPIMLDVDGIDWMNEAAWAYLGGLVTGSIMNIRDGKEVVPRRPLPVDEK